MPVTQQPVLPDLAFCDTSSTSLPRQKPNRGTARFLCKPSPAPHTVTCPSPSPVPLPYTQACTPLKENPGLPSRGIFTPPRPTQSSHFPRPPCPPPGGSHFPGVSTSPQALQLHLRPTPTDVRPPRCSSSPNHAHPQGLAPDLQSKKPPWVPVHWLPISLHPGPEPVALPTLRTRLPA